MFSLLWLGAVALTAGVPPSASFDDDLAFLRQHTIGLSPSRATGVLGSWDADRRVLTIVRYTRAAGAADYVNSMWEIQKEPYRGDVLNSYNDGPPAPGAKPLGPFYELETSSPAAALGPGARLTHVHRTLHAQGERTALDALARKLLGVSLETIESFSR